MFGGHSAEDLGLAGGKDALLRGRARIARDVPVRNGGGEIGGKTAFGVSTERRGERDGRGRGGDVHAR